MCVLIKSGTDAKLIGPMLIFKNTKFNYPVQSLLDSVKYVCYRAFTKVRNLWLDNVIGHSGEEAMKSGRERPLFPSYFD
ncbi:hypothetical protein PHMEG_0006062 [Phytophthora megakarya]|uniref:Uncharacterized protein n=1 Tax=Phytophthora megakarya TaxID=4795 RepID=A0A225WPU1_9STRA|nr:hypothetical protein PHMEG_0006062 [Phytophthora megakarya]